MRAAILMETSRPVWIIRPRHPGALRDMARSGGAILDCAAFLIPFLSLGGETGEGARPFHRNFRFGFRKSARPCGLHECVGSPLRHMQMCTRDLPCRRQPCGGHGMRGISFLIGESSNVGVAECAGMPQCVGV